MEEQGLVEGEDWDFFLYIDGVKMFSPMCPEGIQKCYEEGDPEPIEEYIFYPNPSGKGQRVRKDLYDSLNNATLGKESEGGSGKYFFPN